MPLRSFSSDADLHKTALFDEHVKLGGKMVPFAGYALPVQYKDSLINSHLHCRNVRQRPQQQHTAQGESSCLCCSLTSLLSLSLLSRRVQSASLFDVSHMGQLRIWGAKRVEFLESVVVGDIAALAVNQMRLSVMTNEAGGIIDDCMVTSKQDHIYMVINAGCKEKDLAHLATKLKEFNTKNNADVRIEELHKEWSATQHRTKRERCTLDEVALCAHLSCVCSVWLLLALCDRELIALQGPKAAAVLAKHLPKDVDLAKLPFLFSANLQV